MKKLAIVSATAAALSAFAAANCAAQDPMPGHTHAASTLFVAQADGAKTVPPSGSAASATGVFVVDPARRSVAYDLTYQGLEHGGPKTIALYNFGPGRNGRMVHALCGEGAPACPDAASGNIRGTWDGQRQIDNRLLGEIANSRLYVQIDGGDGRPEVRAQLEPNGAMVPIRNYVAHLTPTRSAESRGVGTAFYSEVHFADGRTQVFYQVTVANTSGPPREISILPHPKTAPLTAISAAPAERATLPGARLRKARAAENGGTIEGSYELHPNANRELLATALTVRGGAAVVVSTAGVPGGELAGVLEPVQ